MSRNNHNNNSHHGSIEMMADNNKTTTQQQKQQQYSIVDIGVGGMTCSMCSDSVTKAIQEIVGVRRH